MPTKCHDCGVLEGAYHIRGCGMERCPFCGGQLTSCGCRNKHFYPETYNPGWDPITYKPKVPFNGLPEAVYQKGLPPNQVEEWERHLGDQGRIPFILYPNMCGRCGDIWPEMFRVPDHEWQTVIPPEAHHLMLCHPCYETVKTTRTTTFPTVCARCGKTNPEPFQVHTVTWNDYIEPRMRKATLCRPCFDTIKGLIDAERAR